MTDRRTFVLRDAAIRRRAAAYIVDEAPAGFVVKVGPPNRTLDQNARMWAMLSDISRQVEWYGRRLEPEDWKHVFTAGLRKLSVVPNLDGTGFVALGLSTSRMGKRELGELMDLMDAFGAERGVQWSNEAREVEAA